MGIPPTIFLDMECESRHATSCCGNLLMLKMATSGSAHSHSHTLPAHPAASWYVTTGFPQRWLQPGSRADGPAWCSYCRT